MDTQNNFHGPLFIVGLSRSGTKLIRDILNRNNGVLIPEIETQFIPEILTNKNLTLGQLHKKIKKTEFVNRFPEVEWPSLERLNKINTIDNETDLIETILKFYASEENNQTWDNQVIWGDKTPSYLRHLDLLNRCYPHCKFIHIIRDPRDRALSVKNTWGKSMYRATELWRKEIQESCKWRSRKDCYMELKYEDLLVDTEDVLKKICSFLNVEYSSEMLQLIRPSEKYGTNSKLLKIGKKDKSNYNFVNPKRLKRIEEIAYPIMKNLGYNIEYANRFRPYSSLKMFIFKFIDFFMYKINVKIKGY